jgi:phosphoribosyl-ATP pyrophosphohydrolase/phosphoribosyl-AMP cyclohydrolase
VNGHKAEAGTDRIWIDMALDAGTLAWDKQDGLLPVVVQDADTRRVLMVGYMNREALQVTLDSGNVTFFSRSKQRLWTKGESSGHVLEMTAIRCGCRRARAGRPATSAPPAASRPRPATCWARCRG